MKEIQENLEKAGLSGWVHPWDISRIYEYVSQLEPVDNYLEIGVAHGASLAVASLAAKDGVGVYGIDLIDWGDREEKVEAFLELYGKKKKHEFISGNSQLWARYWDHGEINVLYIDGNHTYEGVVKDIASWTPWVKEGGIILFDDYKKEAGVTKAVHDIIFEHKCFREQEADEELFICKKN